MKASESRNTTTSSNQSTPFFSQNSEESFFSDKGTIEAPFFIPSSNRQDNPSNSYSYFQTASNSHSSKPFFNRSEEGSFFSQTKELEKALFSSYPVQTKLAVGEANDKYKKQTNLIAENSIHSNLVQRKCENCEEDKTTKPNLEQDDSTEIDEIRNKYCFGVSERKPQDRFQLNEKQARVVDSIKAYASNDFVYSLLAIDGWSPSVRSLIYEIFQTKNLKYSDIKNKIIAIRDKLNAAIIEGATCKDEGCWMGPNVIDAFVDSKSNKIVLCNPFFYSEPMEMRHILIHEAAHLTGIDSQRANMGKQEFYCKQEDTVSCDMKCKNIPGNPVDNVDVWTVLIECLKTYH